jgi:hypothetical protein
MAILKASSGSGDYRSYKLDTLAPKGTFPAICVDCMESMEVERKKWQSEEIETVDLLRFLFIVKTDDGAVFVQSHEMKISAYKESSLAKFIEGWTGDLPAPGFDTLNMVGELCQLTINHKTSTRGNLYPVIKSIAPLLDTATAPKADALEIPDGSRSGIELKSAAAVIETKAEAVSTQEDPF